MVGLAGLLTPSASAYACCAVAEPCCHPGAQDCPAALRCADAPAAAKLASIDPPVAQPGLSVSPQSTMVTDRATAMVPRALVRSARLPRYILQGSLLI